jgi:hypothetical protein
MPIELERPDPEPMPVTEAVGAMIALIRSINAVHDLALRFRKLYALGQADGKELENAEHALTILRAMAQRREG